MPDLTPFSAANACAARGGLSRRLFLQGLGAALTALAGLRPVRAGAQGGPRQPSAAAREELAGEPWATLAVVQEHLFPSEPQAPGASDIHATAYLREMLALPDAVPAERDLILQGAEWLNIEVGNRHPGKRFADLEEEAREGILKQVAATPTGQHWVMLLLYYIIEALLADPVYGGNPEGIGWKWLGHTPGFPRPPFGKRYFELKAGR